MNNDFSSPAIVGRSSKGLFMPFAITALLAFAIVWWIYPFIEHKSRVSILQIVILVITAIVQAARTVDTRLERVENSLYMRVWIAERRGFWDFFIKICYAFFVVVTFFDM